MKHLVAVLSEPVEGKDAEYHDYYENLHLDEVLVTTGWQTAQRFVLSDEAGAKCPLPYLALYEVEADDSSTIIPTMNATRAERQQSKALNRRTAGVWVFSASGPVHGTAGE
jgi:hypothetical protein